MKVAVILAAGVGSRLRPETYEKPKCLVNIAGRPVLEYQLTAFENIDIDKIVIVTGYLSDKIIEYLKTRKNRVPIEIIKNERYLETNNMYSLKLALDFAGIKNLEGLYIINGDVIIEPRIAEILSETEKTSVIAVDKSQYLEESMKVIVGNNGFVKDISKNISPIEFSAVSIDFYKFVPEEITLLNSAITEFIQEGHENLWTEIAIQRIIKEKNAKIKTVDITGFIWWEIDNKMDKERAEYRVKLLDNVTLLKDAEIFAFDLDGTIILGKNKIPGASELVEFLKNHDKKVYFITNNSSMPNPEHYKRLSNILDVNLTPEMIFSSLDYIGEILLQEKSSVYALLPKKSIEYLSTEYGITFVNNNPDIVLVGFDTELSYEKLKKASIFIQNGARYYLAHPDIRCPTDKGFIPDAGSISKVIELTTNRRPDIIGGKPNPKMLEKLAQIHGIPTRKICYIGDRLETDIEMSIRSGAVPILFLTGDTTFEDIYQNPQLKEKIILGENPKFLVKFLQRHWASPRSI